MPHTIRWILLVICCGSPGLFWAIVFHSGALDTWHYVGPLQAVYDALSDKPQPI